ncbi:tetratricopeptide repeat protein [Actinoplanes sp. NPDC051494]|uniref:tetratricopeptide repeat protein n=1 Tax=Actinoplanes sp. NPDC051494 TaxID=3363907 RepID=UPI0037BDB46C
MSTPIDRARYLLLAGRPEQALQELGALPIDEAFGPPAMQVRCAALILLKRWPEAVEAARAGLAAGGPDPQLLLWLGQAEQEMGHPEAVEQALLGGLALDPGDVDLLCAYADLCVAEGQPDKAAQLVAHAAAEDPHAAVVFATRVRVAFALGDDREAERIGQEFVAAYPEDPYALALLGSANAVRGDARTAYSNYRQAAAAQPANEVLTDVAMEMRVAQHPLMRPLYPMRRFGPLQTWLAWIALTTLLRATGFRAVVLVLTPIWLLYCIYSWVVPPLLRRHLRRSLR